mgnify:CR=1 FL=1
MSTKSNTKKLNKGFTLIEILVVLGIITIIGSISIIMGVDDYRRQLFRSDRDVLITALQHARAQSVSNICLGDGCDNGKPHGVYISDDEYIMFQGESYATRDTDVDAVIDADSDIEQSGISEVVFEQLSGDVSSPGDIVLTDSLGRVSTTTVGSEGQIFWTH